MYYHSEAETGRHEKRPSAEAGFMIISVGSILSGPPCICQTLDISIAMPSKQKYSLASLTTPLFRSVLSPELQISDGAVLCLSFLVSTTNHCPFSPLPVQILASSRDKNDFNPRYSYTSSLYFFLQSFDFALRHGFFTPQSQTWQGSLGSRHSDPQGRQASKR